MTAGRLDQRITLQQRVAAVDAAGQDNYTWAPLAALAEVWASAEPIRGREFFAASGEQAAVDVRFTIRWRGDLDGTMRLVWRGRPYALMAEPIDVQGRREWLELMCVTGVGDGR